LTIQEGKENKTPWDIITTTFEFQMSFNKKKLTNLGPIRGCPHLRAVHNIAILFIKGCWVRTRIIADFQDVIPAMSNFLYARNIPSLDPTTAGSGTLGEI